MKQYKVINIQWSYDDSCNDNYTTGECDYVGEHYLVSLLNVDDPFDAFVQRVEKINFSSDAIYIGRILVKSDSFEFLQKLKTLENSF